MLARQDMQRLLLDFDVLTVIKHWIQPLPNGSLGNVTVRQRIIESVASMKGEQGISPNDLKRSELGKVIMLLYRHKSETPKMKTQLKALIEQWSRPIFQKSGNMRDLGRVARGGSDGIAAISARQPKAAAAATGRKNQPEQDLNSLITSGKRASNETGTTRVRVPFSKGFAFSVRPQGRSGAADGTSPDSKRPKDNRDKLTKRMVEKGRAVSKNQRSANVSVEGRVTKG
jgi:transcription factor SPN1